MFNKSVSQLNEDDIKTLVENKERESSILEFKQELSGTDHEKKEISKDVSAMANAEGGFVIFGIREVDGQAEEIVGTPKTIGRQPVEVWIENVLITNVRPKITIIPKVINLTSSNDRALVVLNIPVSPRRPHMVVTEGRNAYYTRHNYQATYADEHEVRSMFTESKSLGDEMKSFLTSRHLVDELDENFALNPLSKQLSKTLRQLRELPNDFSGNPFVLFSACPRYLEERVDIASADFRAWLDENNRINLFNLDIDFLDYNKTVSSDSIRSIKETMEDDVRKRLPYRYVGIYRNGYVENSLAVEIMWPHKDFGLMFQLAYFTVAFWLFMKFLQNFYTRVNYPDEINVTIALADIENVTLHGFGRKNDNQNWLQPYDFRYGIDKMPTCKQKNVKIEKIIIASELNDEYIEKIVKEVSRRVSNAFGEDISKCFDDNGVFDRNQLRGFRNIH